MNLKQRALWGLSCGHFILDMYAAILIPLYPIIAQRLDINIVKISVVIAIGHAVASILQPVFGHISDKLNKRFFMFWGLIFASLFVPLGYFAPNAYILTLCLVLGMAGNAFYHPQTTTIIKNFYKENTELSQAVGIFLALGTIGYSIGPYVSTYIIQVLGDDKYVYLTFIGVICALVLLFFVPKTELKPKNISSDFKGAIKEIVSNKICLFLILVTVVKSALIMSFGTYMPFLFKKFGFEITNIGLLMSAFFIISGISMFFSGILEKKLKLKGMIALSYLPLLPLTILTIIFLNYNKILASLFFILTGFFVLLSAGVVLAYAQQAVSKEHTGTISGIIQGFTLALGSLLLIPFGFVAQKFGAEIVLILITSIAFICAVCTLKMKFNKARYLR